MQFYFQFDNYKIKNKLKKIHQMVNLDIWFKKIGYLKMDETKIYFNTVNKLKSGKK